MLYISYFLITFDFVIPYAIFMRRLILLLIALLPLCVFAQSKIYRGNSTYSSNVLYTWDGRHLYRGRSTYSSDILYTIDDTHVYRGRSTYSSHILLTLSGKIPIPILLMAL